MLTSLILTVSKVSLSDTSGRTPADDRSVLVASILTTVIGLALWLSVLWRSTRHKDRSFHVEISLKKPHCVQTVLQLCLYVYWGLYWDEVKNYAPLIGVQLVFAYLFEMLLSWSRNKTWHLGFGPFPVVLSINLFLWFKDEYFYFQLLLIALAYLVKEFVTWKRSGKRTHLFNPSGISLSVVSVGLMAAASVDMTNGLDLIWSFYLPPNYFEVIFLLALASQFLFGTTPVTFGAAVALYSLFVVSKLILGTSITASPIDIVVFLGLTFLVTDPSTSPRTNTGKFLFGFAYGCGIMAAYVMLRYLRQPTYFDKILLVPIVNVLVRKFDVVAERLQSWMNEKWIPSARCQSAVYLGLYVIFFIAISPALKRPVFDFVDPLPESRIQLSAEMEELRVKHIASRLTYPQAYEPFGFRSEFAHFRSIRRFEPETAQQHTNLGNVLRDTGRIDEAIQQLRQALIIDSSYAPAYLQLGNALLEQGKPGEATGSLRQALEFNPADAKTHLSLGTALGMQGLFNEAIGHFRRALEIDPTDCKSHVNLGITLLGLEKPGEAVGHFRQALEIEPHNSEARRLLNLALTSQRQRERGRDGSP